MMQINIDKTKYMMFSRIQHDFVTRLNIDGAKIDLVDAAKIVGVWLTSDLKWERNTREPQKKAYSRVSMLTKLKYVGVSRDDLMDRYILYIRSVLEYCAVVWHSSLTVELANSLERVQKTCLRVILGEDYDHYEYALEMCNLKTLFEEREERCLSYVKK
jgi:hypothetical protein